jgi:hypothetical protein
VQEYELQLSVGDVVRIGNVTLTVMDIEGDEVSFRIDEDDDFHAALLSDFERVLRPR